MKPSHKATQIVEDDFIGTKFGPNSCLEVVAWCGEKVNYNKMYTVFCSVCAEDPELFGYGLFLITKAKIKDGRVPCGCSRNTRWSKEQYVVKIQREIENREFKYVFLGFIEPFKGRGTKIHLTCELGETRSVSISNFLRGQNCPLRKNHNIGVKNKKDDADCVESFMETGAYPVGTTFQRCSRKDKNGWAIYWEVNCGNCGETFEASIGNLTKGTRGCSCSQRAHNRAYIHLVKLNSEPIGVKFGITSMLTRRRLYEQNRKSISCELIEYGVWVFEEVSSCRRAERLCKEIYNNHITKELLPDGYTETAPLDAISRIVLIYEENGGVMVNV